MYAKQYGQYQKEQYVSNNQGRLIVMMYEGAIRFLNEALKGIHNKDVGARGHYLNRADKIIAELNITLDMQKGGDIARNLSRLYIFVRQQILVSNARGDEKPLLDAIEILTDLKSAWEQIVKGSLVTTTVIPVEKPQAATSSAPRKGFAVTAY